MLLAVVCFIHVNGQSAPTTIKNPVLPGFHPDPSICRVNDDYYMVNSSFTWYPGLPVYHSKDLVNWKLVAHALNRLGMVNFNGLTDNDGIWAPTIRYHNGLFYIITTVWKGNGNFYITAKDPGGPWSDPVWLKDAPGIDPSLLWDDDGKCYYSGTEGVSKKDWPSQVAIWVQELDIEKKKLIGERKIISYGHANNAQYAEGPHIYKINGQYMLLMAEGGTNEYHAITVHHSKNILGPYIADKINPVLSHRHLGSQYPVQAVGHSDLVQTANGDWYAVFLAKRMLAGYNPLARETFLAKVVFENGTPIYNPGAGRVLMELQRPNLPWTPVAPQPAKDEFNDNSLSIKWYYVRAPHNQIYTIQNGQLVITLQPAVIDSLVNAAMLLQKTNHHIFTATTKLSFKTNKANEQAGLILYRTSNGYYSLMKDNSNLVLTKVHLGKKTIVASVSYTGTEVCLSVSVNKLDIDFSYGTSAGDMKKIGTTQHVDAISDNKMNRFNGTGVGIYATANGLPSNTKASFDWFEYNGDD